MSELRKKLDVICSENEYQKRADELLKLCGLEFRAVLIGSDCPAYCKDAETDTDMDKLDTYPRKSHIHGKHYRCMISGKDRGHVSFDFWNSYADEEKNYLISNRYSFSFPDRLYKRHGLNTLSRGKKSSVRAYDLLACLVKNNPGTFEDFASEYGHDTDSRKAEQTYHAVVKEWRKVEKFFTQDEIEALQEIQ